MIKRNFPSNRQLLIGILVLSVLVRVAASLYLGNSVEELPGTNDQLSYHHLALRVLDGHGFTFGQPWWPLTQPGEPTAHWSFLYTFYLTAVYGIFGPTPLVARLIQAIAVGVLHPLLAYLLGRRLFSERVGLAAALLTAGYVYFIYYAGALMTEPFYITGILAVLVLAIRFLDADQGHAWPPAIGLGLALGAVVLLRQLFLLLIPVLFLWLWWVRYRQRGKIPFFPLVVAGLIVVALMVPFTVYNYARFDRLVLLNTNAGYAFFWGNHPVYGTHFRSILPPEMGSYLDLVPLELRDLDEAALDQALLEQGLQFVVDDPGRYVLLSLSRIPAYFMFWPSPDSGLISNLSRVASFGLTLPFMLYGLIRAITRQRLAAFVRHPAFLLLLFAAAYTVIHLLTWALIRYRLPVDAVMLVFAGLAVVSLLERLNVLPTPSE